MKLQTVFFAAIATMVLGGSMSANAQFGLYGTVSAERVTSVPCLTQQLSLNNCSYSDNTDRLLGAGGGAYYDWKKYGPAVVGVDVRAGSVSSKKTASINYAGDNATRSIEFLGGPRARFSARHDFLSPYAEVLAGWSKRTLTPILITSPSLATQTFFAYRAVAGLDINLAPVLAVRLPEVSFGQNIGMNGAKSNLVQSISVGVVFHMPNDR